MAKFDLSKLTEKFDLKGIVDSVKSVISPEDIIPKNLEGDPVAAKLALIRTTNESLIKLLEQQQQEITKVNALISSVMKDLAALKEPATNTETTVDTASTSPASEVKTDKPNEK